MIVFGLSAPVCDVIRPRPFIPTPDWATKNIVLPPGSEIRGRLRLDLFPHCREPLACFDDPAIAEISLQWASRLGKTVIGQACCAKLAATNPNPMAWADADQKGTERVLKRLWKILAKVPALASRCPPPRLRASDKIEFPDFLIHGAWSGSASSAADYAAFLVVLNEIDKMSRKSSDEADFAELMTERAKGFLRSKVIRISTPGYKGRSRIESARLAGDNRGRFVPCPKCNYWQQLWTGDGIKPGGLRWEKLPGGRSDKDLARRTAWYECMKCGRKILDSERFELLNAAVWVPEGMSVTGSGTLTGRAARPGPHASFGPLPTLYSLLPSITWGYVAHKFLETRSEIQKRRNYHNSWESLTWDAAPQRIAHEELAARLCTQDLRGVCPPWAVFLTRGVDVLADGHTYQWAVLAWGKGRRAALVDWGVTQSDATFSDEIQQKSYPHADSGRPLKPGLTLVDSGDGEHTNEVYQFCRTLRGVLPCKGSKNSAFAGAFRLSGLDGSDARGRDMQLRLGGQVLVVVNGEQSQWWIENLVRGLSDPEGPNGLTLPQAAAEDPELLGQLVNEYPDQQRTVDGYQVHKWKKRGHNEWRDAARYAWVAAQWQTKNGQLWDTIARQPEPTTIKPKPSPAMTTPDGRPFLISER